jgi:hypothetical protein
MLAEVTRVLGDNETALAWMQSSIPVLEVRVAEARAAMGQPAPARLGEAGEAEVHEREAERLMALACAPPDADPTDRNGGTAT